jgi:hypothetical protein
MAVWLSDNRDQDLDRLISVVAYMLDALCYHMRDEHGAGGDSSLKKAQKSFEQYFLEGAVAQVGKPNTQFYRGWNSAIDAIVAMIDAEFGNSGQLHAYRDQIIALKSKEVPDETLDRTPAIRAAVTEVYEAIQTRPMDGGVLLMAAFKKIEAALGMSKDHYLRGRRI